jgi:hypothetical protein
LLQRLEVAAGIHTRQQIAHSGSQVVAVDEMPISICRHGKPVGDFHAFAGKRLIHLSQRGVLATHLGQVIKTNLFKPQDMRHHLPPSDYAVRKRNIYPADSVMRCQPSSLLTGA